MQVLIWGLKCLLSMLRCMLGSVEGVKSENLREKGELKKGVFNKKRGLKVKTFNRELKLKSTKLMIKRLNIKLKLKN